MITTRKYIIIPEYAPLYAMRTCFGPTHGPLDKPCPTPVDVIGGLLRQSGSEKVTIYEVVKQDNSFSAPVQLTLSNYRLPYEEIAGASEPAPDSVTIEEAPAPVLNMEPVLPTVLKDESPEVPVEPEAETAPVAETNDTEPTETPAKTNDAGDGVVVKKDPYAGMTKAERREARRKEAEAAAAAAALSDMEIK